jgi:hypothetical protein
MKIRVEFGDYHRFLRCKTCKYQSSSILVKSNDPCPKCGRENVMTPVVARWVHVVRVGWFGQDLWALDGHDYAVATDQNLLIMIGDRTFTAEAGKVYQGKKMAFMVSWGNEYYAPGSTEGRIPPRSAPWT